jgi:hypothetical protein
MATYRKKPIIIEAFQMTKRLRGVPDAWPEWLVKARELPRLSTGSLYLTREGDSESTLSICTLEGQHEVSWNDWIIRGIKGELYPRKPDIFEATYEKVE